MAAELAVELHHPELGGVLLAHMSEACNDGPLALRIVSEALSSLDYRGMIDVATQERPTPLYDVAALRARVMDGEQLHLFAGRSGHT